MKRFIFCIIIVLLSTALFAEPKVPKNVKVLFTSGYEQFTSLIVKDTKTNEIYVIRVDNDEIVSVVKTGMKQTDK